MEQILDIRRVKVSVGIPESDVPAVRKLTEFEITIDALNSGPVRGTRHFLSQKPETFAHLYKLEIALDNKDGEMLPGMFARVNIIKQTVMDSLSVPLYAVINRNGLNFVYIEKDGTTQTRMVETGILEGWKIQITRGLVPGDRVIVVGHRSVDEGQQVNVVRTIQDSGELFR